MPKVIDSEFSEPNDMVIEPPEPVYSNRSYSHRYPRSLGEDFT
jgi:hypothetical protein